MRAELIERIFAETAYVRMGGSESELRAANYLKDICGELGLDAHLEDFEVPMANMKSATLIVDGKEIECKGYFCAWQQHLVWLWADTSCCQHKCQG